MTTLKMTLFSQFFNIRCLLFDIYWIDFCLLNSFLINFGITYPLKLVSVWINISSTLQTRLLKLLFDIIKNIFASISFLVLYHFLLSVSLFLCIITSHFIKYVMYCTYNYLCKNNAMLASPFNLLYKTEVILFPNKMILEHIRNSLTRYLSVKQPC